MELNQSMFKDLYSEKATLEKMEGTVWENEEKKNERKKL